MLGNTRRSRIVSSTLSLKSLIIFIFWTREKSTLHNKMVIWEYQVRGWLTLWISGPKVQARIKSTGFPSLTILNRISVSFKNFDNSPYLGYRSKHINNEPTEAYLFLIKHITKLMKRQEACLTTYQLVKLGVDENIGHVNKTIGHFNEAIQY